MSIFETARERLQENRYSTESWNILIKEAQEKPIETVRQFFEDLVDTFSTCGRFWKIYIEQEVRAKNYEHAEQLFNRSLDKILHIDLWKCYLVFFKESRSHLENFDKLMIDAYELALDKIGLDVMSYSIWLEYINFLKSLNKPDDQQTRQRVLTVYTRALKNPMINIDQMWKELCVFEGMTEPAKPTNEFLMIKKVAREYESVTRPLERHLPALPLNKIVSFDEEMKQLQAWKRYILWEKSNPLKLECQEEIMRRVLFAYEQSFLCLAYHCDMWHEAASYLYGQSRVFAVVDGDKAVELKKWTEHESGRLYERAIGSFMASNALIYLAYAELEERLGNLQRVYEIFERSLKNPSISEPTLLWIHYIRFARRHEDINAARKLFRRAREDSRSTYHLFIANANLEYFSTKDKSVGFKIFHLGAKKYSNEPDYVRAYLKYMTHLNEDNNTRVLFERVLSSDELPTSNINEIWSEFLKFECGVGDLASILKVDKKRQKFYETTQATVDWSDSVLLVDRYKYMDLMPCSLTELKSIGYKDIPTSNRHSATTLNNNAYLSHGLSQSEVAMAAANELKKAKYPQPDTAQMLPFKPVRNASGGVFPFPPLITDLVKRLPPPTTFQGPFVKIDEFLKQMQSIKITSVENILTEDFQLNYVYLNGEPMREMEHISNGQSTSTAFHGSIYAGHKRPVKEIGHSSQGPNSDDEDSKKSKTMDIYKQRQYKKLMQQN